MSDRSTGSARSRNGVPPILIDRSLGWKFAVGLERFGFAATHLDTLMPVPEGEHVEDVTWIEHVGANGWIALCVNPDMYKVRTEMDMIRTSGARVFSLGSAQMCADMKHFVMGRWWLSIVRRSRRAGPCFWRVYLDQPPRKAIR